MGRASVGAGVTRGVLVAALVGSAALGLATGAVVHRTVAAADAPARVGASSTAPGSVRPTTTDTSSPTDEPSTAAPSVTPEAGPAFTSKALLLPSELVTYGWVSARVIQSYDELPSPPITPCGTPGQPEGLYRSYAAVYASARTTAAEVVMRFDTVAHAEAAFAGLQDSARTCSTAEPEHERRTVGEEHTPAEASRVDEARWWRTSAADGGPTHGVLAIGRSGDRVLVLHLESDLPGSDPADTTKIEPLLIQATRRLV